MSYDLETLASRYSLQIGSIRFSTSTDLAGTAVIPATTGASPVIHAVVLQASAYFPVQLEKASGAASAYWIGFGNQTALSEQTRIVCDSGTAVFAEATAGIGSGVLRVYYSLYKGAGLAVPPSA